MAALAKLELSNDEVVKFQAEIDSMLQHFKDLDAVNTEGVNPTSQVTGLTNVHRPDLPQPSAVEPEELVKLAPKSKAGYLQVPRVLDQ